jgi:glutathione peroxidase-family protein
MSSTRTGVSSSLPSRATRYRPFFGFPFLSFRHADTFGGHLQFGKQEPGTAAEIIQFARTDHGATFPIMAKVEVNGPNAAPIWKFLRFGDLVLALVVLSADFVSVSFRKQIGGLLGSTIKWNWTKFLCSREGVPVKRFGPPTKPFSCEDAIVAELEKPVPEHVERTAPARESAESSVTQSWHVGNVESVRRYQQESSDTEDSSDRSSGGFLSHHTRVAGAAEPPIVMSEHVHGMSEDSKTEDDSTQDSTG